MSVRIFRRIRRLPARSLLSRYALHLVLVSGIAGGIWGVLLDVDHLTAESNRIWHAPFVILLSLNWCVSWGVLALGHRQQIRRSILGDN